MKSDTTEKFIRYLLTFICSGVYLVLFFALLAKALGASFNMSLLSA